VLDRKGRRDLGLVIHGVPLPVKPRQPGRSEYLSGRPRHSMLILINTESDDCKAEGLFSAFLTPFPPVRAITRPSAGILCVYVRAAYLQPGHG
jgi:hypothetical protein